jgi:hypothetical protein
VSAPLPSIECRLQEGTGTAGRYLRPVFDAWARTAGVILCPGTANGCAEAGFTLPDKFVSLSEHADLLALEGRRFQPGYDPRLYPVLVNEAVLAWVFRWSADDVSLSFVGTTSSCAGPKQLEIIAGISFRHGLGLATGDAFELRFL